MTTGAAFAATGFVALMASVGSPAFAGSVNLVCDLSSLEVIYTP